MDNLTVEYGGGLGDMFHHLYRVGWHALQTLPSDTHARLNLCVHVPAPSAILGEHPHKARIEVVDDIATARDWWSSDVKEGDWARWRQELGLKSPPDNPANPEGYKPLFFPTAQDRETIAILPERYVVFAPTAGLPGRSFPDDLREDVLDVLMDNGNPVVCLGSQYDRHGRHEPHYPYRPSQIINLVDKVSLAALPEIVRRSAGVVTCHSAFSHLAWNEQKPNVLYYPSELDAWRRQDPQGYCWYGCAREETFTEEFDGPWEIALEDFTNYIEARDASENWCRPLIHASTVTALLAKLRECLILSGDIVECGSYRGGTAAEFAKLAACAGKTVHVFDTFCGLPRETEQDNHHKQGDFGDVTFERVKNGWNTLGVLPYIHAHLGRFADSFRCWNPECLSFAFIDADLYESTKQALEYVYPRLSVGGWMCMDDIGWQDTEGVTKAVAEFMRGKSEQLVHLDDFTWGLQKL